jgi:ribonucleoside-diphosphate reductase alpha chain
MSAGKETLRPPPAQVRTRAGKLVPFDAARIAAAVRRAAAEVGRRDPALADEAARRAVAELSARFARGAPGVEDIQDAVERALMSMGLDDVARAYVLYRRRHAELRETKRLLGVRDELKLSANAVAVLSERYLLRDSRGEIAESTAGMMRRVAGHVADAEDGFEAGTAAEWAKRFAGMLERLEFLPNSPTLMNAGTPLGLLSACFVLPLEDSLESIFTTLERTALIHQAGGGTGFSFSRLRPAGDRVASTGGVASGPLSFMRVFDVTTDVIKRGGRRRGANMAVLDVSHPDIADFVRAKAGTGQLDNFNLSVAVSDRFMRAAIAGGAHHLVNPRTGKTVATVPAADLLRLVAECAWRSGDPGLLFADRINRANPLPSLGRIEATNPCGEVPLLPNESCNLGSLNLARFVTAGHVDWDRLRTAVHLAVRFLDDVIEVNRYPAPELERAARATRKIGLGMMGLAELLAAVGIPYDTQAAVRLAARLARTIREEARRASAQLAQERGPFPLFAESVYARRGFPPLRHAQLTSVAPTGTISLIAGTTSGIEPIFAIAYLRSVLGGHLVEVHPLFERIARDRGFYSDALMADIVRSGVVRGEQRVPDDVRRAFVTALEIAPEWHLRMQAAVQRHVDAAVSKTINLPEDVAVEDVRQIFVDAWRANVKGITVYRYGSVPGQVLSFLSDLGRSGPAPVETDLAYAGGCAAHVCEY